MGFPPETVEIWVDSREYARPIQKATYPPFTKGTVSGSSVPTWRVLWARSWGNQPPDFPFPLPGRILTF